MYRNRGGGNALMRLAFIRRHYAPDGAIERVIESAFEALLERNVAISLCTRAWPATRLQLIEPGLCNPPHVGTFRCDIGLARVVNAAIGLAGADPVREEIRERFGLPEAKLPGAVRRRRFAPLAPARRAQRKR